jgi:hypothetical protein
MLKIIKRVVRRTVWSEKCKHSFYRLATVSDIRGFCFGVALIIVIIHKMEMICCNIIR